MVKVRVCNGTKFQANNIWHYRQRCVFKSKLKMNSTWQHPYMQSHLHIGQAYLRLRMYVGRLYLKSFALNFTKRRDKFEIIHSRIEIAFKAWASTIFQTLFSSFPAKHFSWEKRIMYELMSLLDVLLSKESSICCREGVGEFQMKWKWFVKVELFLIPKGIVPVERKWEKSVFVFDIHMHSFAWKISFRKKRLHCEN